MLSAFTVKSGFKKWLENTSTLSAGWPRPGSDLGRLFSEDTAKASMVVLNIWQQHLHQLQLEISHFIWKPLSVFCHFVNCGTYTYCALIHLNFFVPKVRHLLKRVDRDKHGPNVCLITLRNNQWKKVLKHIQNIHLIYKEVIKKSYERDYLSSGCHDGVIRPRTK